MMTKPVLMIHEVRDWMFDIPLEDYILTFDDGLYSQYYYADKFNRIPTQKIYFVSSGIVCPEDVEQSYEFPPCRDAHVKAFTGVFEDYMKVSQMKELLEDPLTEIGGHSHYHTCISGFETLIDQVNWMKSDTARMMDWFDDNLGFRPTSFCFPYNDDTRQLYGAVVKRAGVANIYGNERIAIESLRK